MTITFSSKRFGTLSPNDIRECDNRLLYALFLMMPYCIESYSCFEIGSKGNPHGHSIMIFYDRERMQQCEAHLNRLFNHTSSKANKYCIKFLPAHATNAVKYLHKVDTPSKLGHYFIKIGEAYAPRDDSDCMKCIKEIAKNLKGRVTECESLQKNVLRPEGRISLWGCTAHE